MRKWIREAAASAGERAWAIAVALLAAWALLAGYALRANAGGGHVAAAVPLAGERSLSAAIASGERGSCCGPDAQRVIARTIATGFKVKVVALRTRSRAASVKIAAFERKRGNWHLVGRWLRVGQRSGWFWHVVTGRFGVETLNLRSLMGVFPHRIKLRLLQSASLGRSAPFRFVVHDGRLEPVDV